MPEIPIVTFETIQESYKQVIAHDFQNMDEEQFKTHMEKWDGLLYKRQPHIHEYIHSMIESHMEMTQGTLMAPQLAIYVMIILDSLYNQKETDELRKLFED